MEKDGEKPKKQLAREKKRAEKRERARKKHIVLCPHCQREVLDHMTECPFCHGELTPLGYRGRNEKTFKIVRAVSYAVLFAIAAAVFVLAIVLTK